eukprot:gene40596-49497_t
MYEALARQAVEEQPNRREVVLNALAKAAGVYADSNKASWSSRISNTVLIQVVEQLDRGSAHEENYKQQLLNFYCYSKQLQLKSLLYIITKNITDFAEKKAFFEAFNPYLQVLPFPYATFWQIVGAKETNVTVGSGRGDYNDTSPSFQHFGALPMLVPVYEAVQLGYNALYLDIDIVLLHDPVPFLTAGTADLVISPELKNCALMPSLGSFSRWASLEPNTGTMFVLASGRAVQYMEGWFRRIVQDNAMNDQRTMDLKHLVASTDCRISRSPRVSSPNSNINNSNNSSSSCSSSSGSIGSSAKSDSMRFCFLSEFLFFTGLMEIFCNRGRKGGSAPRHFLGMARASLGLPRQQLGASSALDPPAKSLGFDLYALLARDFHAQPYEHVHFPLVFHANYCGVKKRCFADRGLWLYDAHAHRCAAFRLAATAYAALNWTEQMQSAQQALLHALQPTLRNWTSSAGDAEERRRRFAERLEGRLVRFHRDATVFRLEGGALRPFDSMQSLLHAVGGQLHLEQVEVWHGGALHAVPIGKPI